MSRDRREKGDGSIGQRADGRWYAYLTVGGRRLYHYGHTREEVRVWLKRAVRDRDEGLLTARRSPMLGVWLGEWLTSIRGSVKPRTWATYEQTLRRYALPDLGRVRLRDLGPEDLERVYDALRARGLSSTTIHHVHVVLHGAFARRCGAAWWPATWPSWWRRRRWPGARCGPSASTSSAASSRRQRTTLSAPSGWSPRRPGCGSGRSWRCAGSTSTWTAG